MLSPEPNQIRTHCLICKKIAEHQRYFARICCIKKQTGIPESFGHCGSRQRQNRHVEMHALEQWNAKALVTAKAEKELCAAVTSHQLRLTDLTSDEELIIAETMFLDKSVDFFVICRQDVPLAGDHEARRGSLRKFVIRRCHSNKIVGSLVGRESADEQHVGFVFQLVEHVLIGFHRVTFGIEEEWNSAGYATAHLLKFTAIEIRGAYTDVCVLSKDVGLAQRFLAHAGKADIVGPEELRWRNVLEAYDLEAIELDKAEGDIGANGEIIEGHSFVDIGDIKLIEWFCAAL